MVVLERTLEKREREMNGKPKAEELSQEKISVRRENEMSRGDVGNTKGRYATLAGSGRVGSPSNARRDGTAAAFLSYTGRSSLLRPQYSGLARFFSMEVKQRHIRVEEPVMGSRCLMGPSGSRIDADRAKAGSR